MTYINIFLEVQASVIKGGSFRDLEGRNKTVLSTENIIEYIENPKRSIDKLLQLISIQS